MIEHKFQFLEKSNKPLSEEKNKESNPFIENYEGKIKESAKIEQISDLLFNIEIPNREGIKNQSFLFSIDHCF